VDLVAAVGADEEAATVVEPCEGAFNHPTLSPQPGAVLGLAARDHRLDAALPDQAPILVVVVAAVGDESSGGDVADRLDPEQQGRGRAVRRVA
jgi:hypothetical protein